MPPPQSISVLLPVLRASAPPSADSTPLWPEPLPVSPWQLGAPSTPLHPPHYSFYREASTWPLSLLSRSVPQKTGVKRGRNWMPLSVPEDLEGTFGVGGHPYTSSGPPSSLLPGPSVWADGQGLMDPPATDQGNIGTLSARSVWPKTTKTNCKECRKGSRCSSQGEHHNPGPPAHSERPPKRLPSTNLELFTST